MVTVVKYLPALFARTTFATYVCLLSKVLFIFFLFHDLFKSIPFPPSSIHNAGSSFKVTWPRTSRVAKHKCENLFQLHFCDRPQLMRLPHEGVILCSHIWKVFSKCRHFYLQFLVRLSRFCAILDRTEAQPFIATYSAVFFPPICFLPLLSSHLAAAPMCQSTVRRSLFVVNHLPDSWTNPLPCLHSPEPNVRRRPLQSGRQRKKAVMMPRVVLTPLKVNGEHVPSGEHRPQLHRVVWHSPSSVHRCWCNNVVIM